MKYSLLLVILGVSSCGIENITRDPTKFAFPQFAGSITQQLPSGLVGNSTDQSPKLCEDADCQQVGSLLRSLFQASNGANLTFVPTLPGLLTYVDQKLAGYEERTGEHFVPCLEGGSTEVATTLGEEIEVSNRLNCFGEYGNPEDDKTPDTWGQISFGRSAGADSVVVREGLLTGLVETMWVSKSTDVSLDMWHGLNKPLANLGASLMHIKVDYSLNTVELATAGANRFAVTDPFACGVQINMDSDRIYLKGKFATKKSGDCNQTVESCESAQEVAFCLAGDSLAAVATTECTAKGLDAFKVASLTPANVLGEDWGEVLKIDYSDTLERFRLEGLQVQD